MSVGWTSLEYEQWKARHKGCGSFVKVTGALKEVKIKPVKRVRQGEVKLRPWEQEWKERLESSGRWQHVKGQSLRFRLANGAWYKPDLSAVDSLLSLLHCFEVKGGKKMKGVAKGVLALKVAASLYPEISWVLCWKQDGQWKEQTILP